MSSCEMAAVPFIALGLWRTSRSARLDLTEVWHQRQRFKWPEPFGNGIDKENKWMRTQKKCQCHLWHAHKSWGWEKKRMKRRLLVSSSIRYSRFVCSACIMSSPPVQLHPRPSLIVVRLKIQNTIWLRYIHTKISLTYCSNNSLLDSLLPVYNV